MTDIDQKAREIVDERERAVKVWNDCHGQDLYGALEVLTAALQSARNEARNEGLTEAIELARSMAQAHESASGQDDYAAQACRDIATAIRVLKTTTG